MAERVRRTKAGEYLRGLDVIHVDDRHVRPPRREDLLGFGQIDCGSHHEHAVVQRQLDEINNQRTFVQDERSARVGFGHTGGAFHHGWTLFASLYR